MSMIPQGPPDRQQIGYNGFQFNPRDSARFLREVQRHEWLIENVLVEDQPAVIGGPKKTMKTTCAIDLAISLASGKPFLGHFPVVKRVKVAVLSGESGTATLQETAYRISKAKGINLAEADVLWQTDLPCLSNVADREQLQKGLAAYKVKVAIIDPLYLCLLGGAERASASNLYEIGPLLLKAADACRHAGATPLFVHHATKSSNRSAGLLDLDDLAWAGIGEFVRQWLLLNRRAPFKPGSGYHALNLAIGGSAGHSESWNVDVNEGEVKSGRCWEVKVSPWTSR